MPKDQTSNRLINSKSPYLLQHAHNPVDWYPWGEEALHKAKSENKPIILSIGYSACHWCHVMERESFEDESIADFMNEHFVSIKVDREERPDIDQIYMDAVQAMGLQGGWPLNVFLLPNTQPFYGGTYFPPKNWRYLLEQIAQAFQKNKADLEKTAQALTTSIQALDETYFQNQNPTSNYSELLKTVYRQLAQSFDFEHGGLQRVPKFIMPSIYNFLLTYSLLNSETKAATHTFFTLHKLREGGIYDQLGGGFARYSTDAVWLVPHFEKMLYDNAQLISLYAKAFQITKNAHFKHVVYETVDFLRREMLDKAGGFYSALDADSEGEEGKFYIWRAAEVEQILGTNSKLFKDYFQITTVGNWEHGNNILHTKQDLEVVAQRYELTVAEARKIIQDCKRRLNEVRAKRPRPGLDDKILTSWNGLVLNALTDAYFAFNDPSFLQLAEANANFLFKSMVKSDGSVHHTYKDGESAIQGFLEDYASLIQGFINFYQATFEEQWLYRAKTLCDYTLKQFYDADEGLFFFTPQTQTDLIARKKDLFDNVIPASNSIMAHNLFLLAKFFDLESYRKIVVRMLSKMQGLVAKYGKDLINWTHLYALESQQGEEIVVVGADYKILAQALKSRFAPFSIVMAAEKGGTLPLMKNKIAVNGKTTIYACRDKVCKLPVFSIAEYLELKQK